MVRASDSGARGRGFDPHSGVEQDTFTSQKVQPKQTNKQTNKQIYFFKIHLVTECMIRRM